MINWLLKHTVKDGNPDDPDYRKRCGALSGTVGILLNILLSAGKFGAGLVTGSVAIVADAVNNLSDAATSVVTLIGFRMAGMEADANHPFGHGRIEYLSGLLVSMAILLMGFEVGKSAVSALFHREDTVFSLLAVVILAVSMLVKLWLYFFNHTLSKKIDSAAMEATAADSLSDMMSTGVVLLSTLMGHFLHIHVDGLAGLLVAVLILKAGWDTAKDTLNPLLGRPMDPSLAKDIDEIVMSHKNILGTHDLIYHDYGPGRAMMSFHAEVPAEGDILELHDLIDHIEREIMDRTGIQTVIHMDPVVRDERTVELKNLVAGLAREIDPALTIHDFRRVPGPTHTNLIFDLVVPYGLDQSEDDISKQMKAKIHQADEHFCPVFTVEHSYIDHRVEA